MILKPNTEHKGHRSLFLIEGTPEETCEASVELVSPFLHENVGWAGPSPPHKAYLELGTRVNGLPLGVTLHGVVVDFHNGIDPDLLAGVAGMVQGGGVLVLRIQSLDGPVWREKLYSSQGASPVLQKGTAEFGQRFHSKHKQNLKSLQCQSVGSMHPLESTSCQKRLLTSAKAFIETHRSPIIVVHSPRGRGKSYGIGRLLAALGHKGSEVLLTGPNPESVQEVIRAHQAESPHGEPIQYTRPQQVVQEGPWKVMVIDEAAQFPLHVIKHWARAEARVPLILSTTTEGYEASGRSFAIRLMPWVEALDRPSLTIELTEPIRWAPEDPVESFLNDALLLPGSSPPRVPMIGSAPQHHALSGRELRENEELLRETFGLLVEAHYRTVPSDLERLLDSPNLTTHVLMSDGKVICASLVADEGRLSPEVSLKVATGKTRLKGHALPENALSHMGLEDAGGLHWVRSVRIAVPQPLRRHGLGTLLVDRVHAHYQPDLFGTLFGLTQGLLTFRRGQGYNVVRISNHRGARSGEPSAMMVKGVSESGQRLLQQMRQRFWFYWPLQTPLMASSHLNGWAQGLKSAIEEEAIKSPNYPEESRHKDLLAFAVGQRTLEEAIGGIAGFIEEGDHHQILNTTPLGRAFLARSSDGLDWESSSALSGCPSVRSFMKRSKGLVAEILRNEGSNPHLEWERSFKLGNSFDE